MRGRRVVFADVGSVHSEMPVERRQAPTPGMIDAQIAQQPGAAFHALDEFVGKQAHLVVGQAGNAQSLDREGDIGGNLARLRRVGFRREGQGA